MQSCWKNQYSIFTSLTFSKKKWCWNLSNVSYVYCIRIKAASHYSCRTGHTLYAQFCHLTASRVFVWNYLPNKCLLLPLFMSSLSNLISKINYQRIDFTITRWFTKPYTTPYSCNKDFREYVLNVPPILRNIPFKVFV